MSNFELSFKFRFQSTHPHGVRPSGNLSFVLIHGFQSTHPHGVRLHLPSLIIRRRVVSIHAPTRGATSERHKGLKWLRSFNPRTHTGCDAICRSAAAYRKSFNPRTHTGCDSGVCSYSRNAVMFQSTHPHGVRLPPTQDTLFSRFVSIHAPTRGATFAPLQSLGDQLFQSTHPHGVRPYRHAIVSHEPRFNPRTHTGCDIITSASGSCSWSFNPRTHTGCDSVQSYIL